MTHTTGRSSKVRNVSRERGQKRSTTLRKSRLRTEHLIQSFRALNAPMQRRTRAGAIWYIGWRFRLHLNTRNFEASEPQSIGLQTDRSLSIPTKCNCWWNLKTGEGLSCKTGSPSSTTPKHINPLIQPKQFLSALRNEARKQNLRQLKHEPRRFWPCPRPDKQ